MERLKWSLYLLCLVLLFQCLFVFSFKIGKWDGITHRRSKYGPLFVGKGFGKDTTSSGGNIVTPTRKSEHKKVEGSYAKVLSKYAKKYEDMKTEVGVTRHDLYARLDNQEVCWFIGKLSSYEKMGMKDAFTKIEVLLTEYSKSLRPKDLSGPLATNRNLEIWYAPGNSEMTVAQNKISLKKYSNEIKDDEDCTSTYFEFDIGFEPEIYQNNELGFRCKRDSNGDPVAAEFEVQTKAPSEMQQ